jgi:hypothetical protein
LTSASRARCATTFPAATAEVMGFTPFNPSYGLLDECVPRALRNDLPGHEVKTVAELGWAGVKNGELLRRAAAAFDLLITVDRNLEYQQSFEGLSLAVIVVHASSNDVTILRPLMPAVAAVIAQTRPGVVTHVGE